MVGGGREEILGLSGQTGFSGASESSELELEPGESGGWLGDSGNVGVDGRAEKSSADIGRTRWGILGDDGEGGKTGVVGTFEKSSSEI